MAGGFESFVILADMRTGSNALEARLQAAGKLDMAGELFNPLFVGAPDRDAAYGMTLKERDADPGGLLAAHRARATGLPGFRLFSDHDPRALALVLDDPACAKVILTRDSLDSYLSLKIARATGQWWLGDLAHRKAAKARFDRAEFMAYRAARDGHLARLRQRLQATGQAAFWIGYDEIGDDAVIAGLLAFLGVAGRGAKSGARVGRRQNPGARSDRVENPEDMARALAELGPGDLDEAPEVTPRPGAGVRAWVASDALNLLYLPVPGTDAPRIAAALGRAGATREGFTQKTLRQWKRAHPGHRSFTVVRHPLARAWQAFAEGVLPAADGPDGGLRATLARSYGVPLPDDPADPGFGADERKAAFLAFLEFLKGCLAGQTAVSPDPAWLPQSLHLEAMAQVALPDAILREAGLAEEGPRILGADLAFHDASGLPELAEIHDPALDRAAGRAYARDYMMFGFGPWQPPAARRGQAA